MRKVERLTDAIGMPVDDGIKTVVCGLRLLGIPTRASCEGHDDRASSYPWVDIGEWPSDGPGDRQEQQETRERNREHLLDTLEILEAFYSERRSAYLACIVPDAPRALGIFRIWSVGAPILDAEGLAAHELVEACREEMREFGSFLRHRVDG